MQKLTGCLSFRLVPTVRQGVHVSKQNLRCHGVDAGEWPRLSLSEGLVLIFHPSADFRWYVILPTTALPRSSAIVRWLAMADDRS